MFKKFRQWREKQIVDNAGISAEAWSKAIHRLPLLERLTMDEVVELKRLATLLLHKKDFSAAHELVLTESMKHLIALQACLPILHLGLEWYEGWHSIIVTRMNLALRTIANAPYPVKPGMTVR